MTISSSLEFFSLPELFRLIEQNSKSGRLIVQTSGTSRGDKQKRIYYVWFQKGRLVAASDRLNHKGLIDLIYNRGWLSPPVVDRLRTLCPPEVPLGIYLQEMKLVSREKLSLIFQLQLHQVYRLFHSQEGWFRFDELQELQDRIFTIPWLEMTGQKIKATEVSMYALRLIENWDLVSEHLPEPNLALKKLVEKPHLKLTSIERQVWELADGLTSLASISQLTKHSLRIIQITAFRIIAVGLVEEIVNSRYSWEKLNSALVRQYSGESENITFQDRPPARKVKLAEKSSLENLLQFFKSKFVEESAK
ncbi:MAG: DUF4388 domain-containing protein [Pleurocapsa sp.]